MKLVLGDGFHANTFVKYGIAETLLGCTERLLYNIWYLENVLSYTKCSDFIMFCSEKTFYTEPNLCSDRINMVASGGSDSSVLVLRNSRPEFRPPDASTCGFITEMLTTRASGVGAPEIM